MFESISFCVGNKTIEVNDEEFCLGELSAECLNITIPEYRKMKSVLETAFQKLEQYGASCDPADRKSCEKELSRLEKMLCGHRLFRVLRGDAPSFEEINALFESTDNLDLDMPAEDFLGAQLTAACVSYKYILRDISSFNDTIRHLFEMYLSQMEKKSPSLYMEALHYFLFDERSYKWISNPISGTGFYGAIDTVELQHIPRETAPGSGVFKIYRYYEVKLLQTLLKMDFYGALEAGYTIRRCAYCKRFFLCKDGRRTKYCDQPAPDDPKHTCAQLGYHFHGIKEAVGDNPRSQSLLRCRRRIDKDFARGNITDEERQRLYQKAKDLFHQAETAPGVSFEEFEKSLASRNLYALCGIERKQKSRGRPKKG